MISSQVFESVVQAIIYGDEVKLTSLFEAHPAVINARFEESKGKPTLLHFIAANGVEDHYQRTPTNAVAIAELLFAHGADPNRMAEFYGGGAGSTPLVGLVSSVHPYAQGLQEALIDCFISHGAKVNGVEDNGMPLSTALAFWYPGAAAKLIELGARIDNLVFAAAAGDLEKVQLWWHGTDALHAPSRYPEPFGREISLSEEIGLAFAKACLCNQRAVADHFIDGGLSVDVRTPGGRTGLHEAAYRGSLEMVKFLIEIGANPSIRDEQFGSFPVHWARAGGQTDIYEYLLPKTSLQIQDYAEFGMYAQVQAVLDQHPDWVNGEDGSGLPLREAAHANELEIVRLLLQRGADRSLTNRDGHDALFYAKRNGHREMIELLQDADSTET